MFKICLFYLEIFRFRIFQYEKLFVIHVCK